MMHGSVCHSTWNNAGGAGIAGSAGSGFTACNKYPPRSTFLYLSTNFACLLLTAYCLLLTADVAPVVVGVIGDDGVTGVTGVTSVTGVTGAPGAPGAGIRRERKL
jgi:hypothetical protein